MKHKQRTGFDKVHLVIQPNIFHVPNAKPLPCRSNTKILLTGQKANQSTGVTTSGHGVSHMNTNDQQRFKIIVPFSQHPAT